MLYYFTVNGIRITIGALNKAQALGSLDGSRRAFRAVVEGPNGTYESLPRGNYQS